MRKNKHVNLTLTAGAIIASLGMATHAQAYDLVKNDNGLTLQMKGDYEIQLRKRTGEGDSLEMDYDDLEIKFHVSQAFDNGISAFGVLEADFKREGDGGANKTIDAGFVGLDFGNFEIGFGKTDYATDNFSVEADYEMGPGDGFDQFNDAGNDLIFGNFGNKTYKVYFSTDLAEEGEEGVKDESSVDLVAQINVAGLSLAFGYQDFKEDGNSESIDTVGARVKGKMGSVGYGIAYTTNDTTDQIDLSLKSKLGGKLSGAIGFSDVSPAEGDSTSYWYANLTHSFSSNVKTFAEIGGNNADDSETGYLAGLRVRF
ncbi:MAG: porin [Arenicella sp.]